MTWTGEYLAACCSDSASGFCRKIESIVYSPAARNSVNSVIEVEKVETVIKNGNDDCPNGFSAPMKGVTPSTQVGRLSGSHSDIGFQLTQFPGKMDANGKAAGSVELKVFNKSLYDCAR